MLTSSELILIFLDFYLHANFHEDLLTNENLSVRTDRQTHRRTQRRFHNLSRAML